MAAPPPFQVALSDEYDPSIPRILPHEHVFSIQVGYKMFKLSGASLSSDAPSYFTNFFSHERNDKVLFIDRDPRTFGKIYNHLQGYVVEVDNEYDFVHLWSDSFYFGLENLQKYLQTHFIFASVGSKTFKIDRTLISGKGNFPNFFTISNDSILGDNFKLIEEKKLFRPPPQRPICAPNRSAILFADVLELLTGNDLIIKNDEHRSLLLRECRYYRFLELEQRIIKSRIYNNPFQEGIQEIILNLNDLQSKGIFNASTSKLSEQPIQYARPYLLNEPKRILVFQVDTIELSKGFSLMKLILNKKEKMALVKLKGDLCIKFMQVFKAYQEHFRVENRESKNPTITLITGLADCQAIINGLEMKKDWVEDILCGPNLVDVTSDEGFKRLHEEQHFPKKRKYSEDSPSEIIEFMLTKSLWKLVMRGNMSRLHCISFDAIADQKSFTKKVKDFL
ncbi:uncharacterized protein PRCAT00001151001 [Priceomyces carsonii]|uniref:uncharacterized protein n=1 Tax=Priceomyces carsonii TaxID=28549 RepID=UPI002ED7CD62|nr:unnamed protein product [Priceomyces carsonii]